jgi:hypothetical protein
LAVPPAEVIDSAPRRDYNAATVPHRPERCGVAQVNARMSDMPQVYQKYELLFTPHLISKLRDLRGEEWRKLIDYLAGLPETHPDALAFSMMMIRLNSCLTCEMDSYRAQRGCAMCARQTILSFKGTDRQLLQRYERARREIERQLEGKQALLDQTD